MKRSKHQNPSSRLQGVTLLLAVDLLIAALGSRASFAAQTADGTLGRTDYRKFEIIAKKNIFNPRRSPAYVPSEIQMVRRRTESLALVGVMSYGNGPMAFFDGSRSDYRKVLKPNDSIAGFKVTSIEPSAVKLISNTTEIEVRVGMQLAREEEGDWKLSVRPESLDSGSARSTPMRSSAQINSERASESARNADNANNPFAGAIGNFLGNGGFPGGGFPGGPQPTVAPTPTQTQPSQPAPASNPDDVLARMARQAAVDRGETLPDQSGQPPQGNEPIPNQGGPPSPNPGGQPSPNPGGQPPNPRGQPRPN
jgi:hypothetical protein